MRKTIILCLLLAAGCGRQESAAPGNDAAPGNEAAPANQAAAATPSPPIAEPIAPGQPGGLPDDRTPVSEAPFSPTSAQGAANIVQTYFAFIETDRDADARALWRDPADADAFAARFHSLHGQIGAPGEIEGAAGSLYVEVPVQVYGRGSDGTNVAMPGTATLRRINGVPGSSAEQRKWHIVGIETRPVTPPPPGGRS
jgi:hypothetical protein